MFCLALNHVIGRGLHDTAPPIGLAFWRWTVAVVLMVPLVWGRLPETLPVYRRSWKVFVLLAFLMIGSTTLFLVTLQFTTAMNVSLINALQPTVTVLLSWVIFRRQLGSLQGLGILLGLLGVMVTVSRGSWQMVSSLSFNAADLVALVSVAGLAGYAISLRYLPKGLGPVDILFGIAVVGCLLLLPAFVIETLVVKPVPFNRGTVSGVLVMGLFGTLVGNLGWNTGNRILGPNRASIFVNLIPVFGILMAVLLLDERLEPYHLLGLAAVSAGIWFVLSHRES